MADRSPTPPPLDPENERELIAFLQTLGACPDEIADAISEDSLWDLTTEVLLAPRPELSLREVAERAGVEVRQAVETLRALGLPAGDGLEQPTCSEADITLVEMASALGAVFPHPETARRLLRVVGAATGRIADATVAAYIADVEQPMVHRGATLLEHARTQAAVVEHARFLSGRLPQLRPLAASPFRFSTLSEHPTPRSRRAAASPWGTF